MTIDIYPLGMSPFTVSSSSVLTPPILQKEPFLLHSSFPGCFAFLVDFGYCEGRMKEKILLLNLYFGLCILALSAVCLVFQVPFMKTWFFSFAWWSFILVMDSLNFRKSKSSPLSDSFGNFLFSAFISVFVWLIFELFNLRLRNWSYHNLPSNLFIRWLGYFVAFATVIPAIRELAWFVESILKGKNLALFKIRVTPFLLKAFFGAGIVSVVLPLTWPRIFFPCVWLCFIFLLEPVNYRLKNENLLKDGEEKWTRFWSWISAGLAAGFLWEFWNFWASSRWEYSLPYLNFWKVFQMPVFGYTGFMPFALEIFAIYYFLSFVHKKLQGRIFLKSVIIVALLIFYAGAFYLIDALTLFR